MLEIKNKPFSKGYVLRTTVKHMRKSVEISTHKTLERISEFEGNSEKSKELIETLSALHAIIKLVDDFQLHNQEILKGE